MLCKIFSIFASWKSVPAEENMNQQYTKMKKLFYNGWLDLFGWGTGKNPTLYSEINKDYPEFNDWGENNISNAPYFPKDWRTLTKDELDYLINKRDNAANLRGFSELNVDGSNYVEGYLLLPDDFQLPEGLSEIISTHETNHDNYYEVAGDWLQMVEAGAIFLPTAYTRLGADDFYFWSGAYWTSSEEVSGAWCFTWDDTSAGMTFGFETMRLGYGFSVRLVLDLE